MADTEINEIKLFLDKLKKKYSKEIVEANHAFIPTGVFPLDVAIGGGIREGTSIEIAGAEGSGKTTLTIRIIANLMRVYPDDIFVYFDFEHVFDWEWAITNGIECIVTEKNGLKQYEPKGNFVLISPTTGETMFKILEDLFDKNDINVRGIIIDSLPAIMFEDELLTKTSSIALGSRANSKLAKFMSSRLSKKGAFMFVINQVRDGMDMYGPKLVKPGGHAIKHMYSYQVELKKSNKDTNIDLKDFINTVYVSELKVTKNKFYGEGYKNSLYISRVDGLSLIDNIANTFIDLGVIKRSGPYYQLDGVEEKILGRENTVQYLKEHPDLLVEQYKQYIKKYVMKPGTPLLLEKCDIIFNSETKS
jgi:recombination protein RecA